MSLKLLKKPLPAFFHFKAEMRSKLNETMPNLGMCKQSAELGKMCAQNI